jgi:hypothetical protein
MDAVEQKAIADVEQYGCHVIHVMEEGDLPPFAYSVGIEKTSQAAELVVVGLKQPMAHSLINEYNRRVRGGELFEAGQTVSGFLQGFDCQLRSVDPSHYREYFGWNLRFYNGARFRVLQLVYPTVEGIWPWDADATEWFRRRQPLLDVPATGNGPVTVPVGKCHTLLWTNDYCKKLKRAGETGKPLRVLFSGSHQSQPSLRAFGVGPGDYIFVIRVEKGRMFIVAGMRVRKYIHFHSYLADVLGLDDSYINRRPSDLEAVLAKEHPDWGHLLPWGCLTEVVLGDGTPINFDRAVPPEIVQRIRFTSRRGERPIKHLDGGVIKSSVSLQGGAYVLSEESAKELMRLVPS